MTPEEIERTCEFLINSHAQFAAEMTALQGEVRQVVGATLTLPGVMGELRDAQKRTDAHIEQTSQQMKLHAEDYTARQKERDERMDRIEAHVEALIDAIERDIEARGGRDEEQENDDGPEGPDEDGPEGPAPGGRRG